jgi:hypothetical protein
MCFGLYRDGSPNQDGGSGNLGGDAHIELTTASGVSGT